MVFMSLLRQKSQMFLKTGENDKVNITDIVAFKHAKMWNLS
jgi:hypothetical protein